jgi:hypothetical protein
MNTPKKTYSGANASITGESIYHLLRKTLLWASTNGQ